MKMNESTTSKMYDLWSRFYDYTFGALVRQRQARAVEQLQPKAGQRVLDLGVGTGMTLRHQRDGITIVGLDLSAGMLAKARKKMLALNLKNCHLVQADAMNPPFADASFDHILITHTISVVSEPAQLLKWARRLIKPGGRIVVLNHFRSPSAVMGWCEWILNPLFVKIGWRSDVTLEDCLGDVDLHVQYHFKIGLIDLWTIVVLGAEAPSEGALPAAPAPPASRAKQHRSPKLAIEGQ